MSVGDTLALFRDLIIIGAVLVVLAAAVRRAARSRRTLYGAWYVSEERRKTGWATHGGRVIVSSDPEELRGAVPDTLVRAFPEPVKWSVVLKEGRDSGSADSG